MNATSVDKALFLLEFLAASGKPASLQQVTDAVKLPKPTAYRLLRSLQGLGYVSRPANSREYLVGPRTARLGVSDPYSALKAEARPILRRLYEEFNETVNLGTLSGNQVLYLDFIETTQALRYIVTPGQSDPYYCTALGRAVVSHLEDQKLEKLVADTKLQTLTPHTVKSRGDLLRRIKRVRQTGFAEEIQESVVGVCCLAANLAGIDFPGAAISIAVPTERLSARRRTAIILALKSLLKL